MVVNDFLDRGSIPLNSTIFIYVQVAELADAQASGACVRKGVGVQVPPRAPKTGTSPFSNHLTPLPRVPMHRGMGTIDRFREPAPPAGTAPAPKLPPTLLDMGVPEARYEHALLRLDAGRVFLGLQAGTRVFFKPEDDRLVILRDPFHVDVRLHKFTADSRGRVGVPSAFLKLLGTTPDGVVLAVEGDEVTWLYGLGVVEHLLGVNE